MSARTGWWGSSSRVMTSSERTAARASQERMTLQRLSRDVFALDLQTQAGRDAAETFLRGTLSSLEATGSDLVGGAR